MELIWSWYGVWFVLYHASPLQLFLYPLNQFTSPVNICCHSNFVPALFTRKFFLNHCIFCHAKDVSASSQGTNTLCKPETWQIPSESRFSSLTMFVTSLLLYSCNPLTDKCFKESYIFRHILWPTPNPPSSRCSTKGSTGNKYYSPGNF